MKADVYNNRKIVLKLIKMKNKDYTLTPFRQ